MAASRRGQKYGISVFDRFRGLLRAGAVSLNDKPVWYEVYRKFPPQIPKNHRNNKIPKIIYPEDLLRKKFQNVFGYLMYKRRSETAKKDLFSTNTYDVDLTDMLDKKSKSIEQRFIEKYFYLLKKGVPQDKIFDETASFFNLVPQSEWEEEETKDKKPKKIRVQDVEELLEGFGTEKNPREN